MLQTEVQDVIQAEAKRDPRITRTRRLLQNALTELLSEKNFPDITVGDIADRATVNRATFYAHFEDKYALLKYMAQERFESALSAKIERAPGFTLANLRLLAVTAYEFLGGFMGHCAPSGPPSSNDHEAIFAMHIQTCIYEIVLAWIRALPPHKRVESPEVIAKVTSWVIFGFGFQANETRQPKRLPPETLADQMLPVLTAGIGALLA